MKLLELKLKNFKGVRDFTLAAQGESIAVFGDNGTGKTTLFDAFVWLLFDKDSLGKKDFAIKTLDGGGQALHGLNHEVEALLEVDGVQLALRKVYAEKWTKKRGSATKEFTGHTVDHFVDGVPVAKREYDARIASIAEEGVFRLLTDPRQFNERLHWEERRKILLDVCGDIADADVLAADERLGALRAMLGKRSIEEHRRVIASRRAELNKELDKIPVRIDEAERGLPDITGLDRAVLESRAASVRAEINGCELQIVRIEAGGEAAEKTKQLRGLEAECLALDAQWRKRVTDELADRRAALAALPYEALAELAEGTRVRNEKERRKQELEAFCDALRDSWHRENAKEPPAFGDAEEICPACGQAIPAEQVAAARQTVIEDFNVAKAGALEQIRADGTRMAREIAGLGEEIDALQASLVSLRQAGEAEQAEAETLRAEIGRLEKVLAGGNADPAYAKKVAEAAAQQAVINNYAAERGGEVGALRDKIAGLRDSLRRIEMALADLDRFAAGQGRVAELKEQERALAAEFERLEEGLFLTEEFIKTKVRLLDEKINSCFGHARFKLFETYISGGVGPCCETTYGGVPYGSGLNSGHKTIVGLDIINTLSGHYKFWPPIFIDNAESISVLPEMGQQVITLVVSGGDKKLRVERAETKITEVV